MEGFETKDISPNENGNGDLKEAYLAEARDLIKAQLNRIWGSGIYGIGMSRGEMLLYCENDVKETCRTFRRMFYSNNMLKRHHIPMRRGER